MKLGAIQFLGHSQGAINGSLAIDRMDRKEKGYLRVRCRLGVLAFAGSGAELCKYC